ncbi:MAG: hypothetical protein Q9217_003375 [Psora testacea]
MGQGCSKPYVWSLLHMADVVPEHVHFERAQVDGMGRDPGWIPRYRPHADLINEEQDNSEPPEIAMRTLEAMVALPYTYDGRTPVEMFRRTPATGCEPTSRQTQESTVSAIGDSAHAAAAGHTDTLVAVSDTPPAEHIVAETLSFTHSTAKNEERLMYVEGIGRPEARNSFRSGLDGVDDMCTSSGRVAGTSVKRKSLPNSATNLKLSLATGDVSRNLRVANRGVRGTSTGSQATVFRGTRTDWQTSTDIPAKRQGPYIPIAHNDFERINYPYEGHLHDSPAQQPPPNASGHNLRLREGRANLREAFVLQKPANGPLRLTPSIELTPASPTTTDADRSGSDHRRNRGQQAPTNSANLLQVPRAQRCRRHCSQTRSSNSKTKRKPVSPNSAWKENEFPNAISRISIPGNLLTQARLPEPRFLTSGDYPDIPSLQGEGYPCPAEAILSHPTKPLPQLPRPANNPSKPNVRASESSADSVPTGAECTLRYSDVPSTYTGTLQLSFMRRQATSIVHLTDKDRGGSTPANAASTSRVAILLRSSPHESAPDETFPLLRSAAIRRSIWGLMLFKRDSLAIILAAIDCPFEVVFARGNCEE